MFVVKNIIKILKGSNINFFTGVPDSILKNLSSSLSRLGKKNHVITANEGGAVSLATGYHLASKKIPVVYFQNSGLGNAINPITSMVHKEIYSIPMIFFIGWRGCPGINDEVQHKVQGKITLKQLQLLNIKYYIFNKKNYVKNLKTLIKYVRKNSQPAAFIFKNKDLNDSTSNEKNYRKNFNKGIIRSDFISKLTKNSKNSRIIATTGFTSRELFQIRKDSKLNNFKDFYMVGAMGHASMVALGYSLIKKQKIICLDGDGAFLMHQGSSTIVAKFGDKNFKYILLNNGCHESVGEQPTAINNINLKKFALSIGYKKYYLLNKKSLINKTIKLFINSDGPSFLEVKIKTGSLKNLLRIKNLKLVKKNF